MSSEKTSRSTTMIVAFAVVIAVVAYLGVKYPIPGDDAAGTVAPAERYVAEQPGADDIVLGEQEIQSLLQTDYIDRLIRDDNFVKLMGNAEFSAALGNADFAMALGNADFATAMGNADFATAMGNADFVSALGNADFVSAMGNADFVERYRRVHPRHAHHDMGSRRRR